MPRNRALIPLAIIAAIALFVIAGVYFADTAKALPSFFPGHSATSTTHHVKHGIAAALLGVACLVLAWFATGPRRPASSTAS
jgi:hypothetical protein